MLDWNNNFMRNEQILQKRIERKVNSVTEKCIDICGSWHEFRQNYQKLVDKGIIASFRVHNGKDWQMMLTYKLPRFAGGKTKMKILWDNLADEQEN